MKTINYLIATLILLSALILVAGGHAAAPLGLMELFIIPSLFTLSPGPIDLNANIFTIFVLLALIGHIILIIAYRKNNFRIKLVLSIIGQILLLSTIVFLSKGFFNSYSEKFTAYWCIPSLLNMLILTVSLFRYKVQHFANREVPNKHI